MRRYYGHLLTGVGATAIVWDNRTARKVDTKIDAINLRIDAVSTRLDTINIKFDILKSEFDAFIKVDAVNIKPQFDAIRSDFGCLKQAAHVAMKALDGDGNI